ncbi:MAG: response regulator [Chloroflexota bacterium]
MPYHVLIVDDQKGFSRLLRSALEMIEQGLIVSEAPSGEEAILEASRTQIDLLIADYLLPGINGLELAKKYRRIHANGKVIVISGVADTTLIKKINESNPDAFFLKPVPMSEFLEAVERCLGLTPSVLYPIETPNSSVPHHPEQIGLGDLLIELRRKINAQAVLLLDDSGQVVAEAGQLSAQVNNAALVSSLVSLFSASLRVASLIDHTQSHYHLFSGADMDGIFTPIDPTHALLLIGKGLTGKLALKARLECLDGARLEIQTAIAQLTTGVSTSAVGLQQLPAEPVIPGAAIVSDQPVEKVEDEPGDFLNIFDQPGGQTGEADSFWDSAVADGTTFVESDKLTYEQALRLGLTPDSAQEQ